MCVNLLLYPVFPMPHMVHILVKGFTLAPDLCADVLVLNYVAVPYT